MCKEFNMRPPDVWRMNYIAVLNYLSYLSQSNEVEYNKSKNT